MIERKIFHQEFIFSLKIFVSLKYQYLHVTSVHKMLMELTLCNVPKILSIYSLLFLWVAFHQGKKFLLLLSKLYIWVGVGIEFLTSFQLWYLFYPLLLFPKQWYKSIFSKPKSSKKSNWTTLLQLPLYQWADRFSGLLFYIFC